MLMGQEVNALQQSETWILTSLAPGKKALSCKWVYKTKYKVDGSVERHKARLVSEVLSKLKTKIISILSLL